MYTPYPYFEDGNILAEKIMTHVFIKPNWNISGFGPLNPLNPFNNTH
jgi:hypothetical protein